MRIDDYNLTWALEAMLGRLPPSVRTRAEWRVLRRLDALARLVETDKSSSYHWYTRHYERHLGPIRHSVRNMLEIGVGGSTSSGVDDLEFGGPSLRMWSMYFPNAELVGIDIHPKRMSNPRLTFERGDQSDPEFLRGVIERHGPFDIVIDDGSHMPHHVAASMGSLFGAVKPGGWYIIEDLAVAYDPNYGGGPPGTPGTAAEIVKGMVDQTLLRHLTAHIPAIAEMHLYGGIVFFQRSTDSYWLPPW